MGSSLQIKMNSEELNTTDPTNLGYMVNNERVVIMTIVNDNIGLCYKYKTIHSAVHGESRLHLGAYFVRWDKLFK